MNIMRIQAIRFLGLGDIDLDVSTDGVTLIEGINHDSPADSNGAGKSSIFEALFWCLFGSTRRGLKGDEVINRHEKGGCYVEVEFSVGGRFYYAQRTRRYGPEGTGFKLFSKDGEITKGTMKDTQVLLEEIMGIGALTFQKSVYFGQGDVKPFAELSDGELKLVFEQALNLTELSDNAARMAGYRKGHEYQVSELTLERESCTIKANALRDEETALKGTIKRFEDDKKEALVALEDELRGTSEKYTSTLANIEALKGALGVDKDKLQDLNDRLEASKGVFAKIDEQKEALASSKVRSITSISAIKGHLAEIDEQIATIEVLVGGPCTLCGTELTTSAVKTAVDNLLGEAEQLKIKSESTGATAAITAKKLSALEAKVAPFKAKIEQMTIDASVTQSNIVRLSTSLTSTTVESGRLDGEIDRIKASIETTKSKSNEEEVKRLEEVRANIAIQEEKKTDAEAQMSGLSFEIETAQKIEAALGNAGIKSLVFDQVTPDLNRYANDYLNILDPGMNVEVSTVKKIKTGELREKFAVNVETSSGAASFAGHSGGEKQKVNLAISLAFNRLMREMSGAAPNILALDEPFESLDSGSTEQVMELLGGLGAGNIFVITHNQGLKDLVSNRILVEKEGGIATIP